jgi:hypothetical protein
MRKIIFLLLLFTIPGTLLNAQTDVSLSPLAFLDPGIALSVEGPVSKHSGLEGYLLIIEDIRLVNINASYYLSPKRGYDGFNIGWFVAGGHWFNMARFGPGFTVGYKVVAKKGVIFDVAAGIGRDINTGFGEAIPYGKLNFGYRFPKKEG